MRLGPTVELEIRQPSDEAKALKIVRKMLSIPPQEIVELMGVGGVTQGTLRKLKRGHDRIV
jgi:CRISPR/Cas system Type II protein with McrA/HNH and RuvC-like nuclease domain